MSIYGSVIKSVSDQPCVSQKNQNKNFIKKRITKYFGGSDPMNELFMKIYTNFKTFKTCVLNFCIYLCKSDKISRCILGDLTKNKLYFFEKTVIMIIYSEIKPPLCIINIWITFNELPYFQHRLDVLAWILRKLLHPQIQVVTRKCLPVVQMV